MGVLVLGAAIAGLGIADEWSLQQLNRAVIETPWTAASRCVEADDIQRLRLCSAAYITQASRAKTIEDRNRAAAAAIRTTGRLITIDPAAGINHVLFAYALVQVTPNRGPDALRELTESYRTAPFLRQQGYWRIWYGARHWGSFDAATRSALLEEALWLQGLGRSDRDAVQGALSGTPAFIPVALRAPGRGGDALPLHDPRRPLPAASSGR